MTIVLIELSPTSSSTSGSRYEHAVWQLQKEGAQNLDLKWDGQLTEIHKAARHLSSSRRLCSCKPQPRRRFVKPPYTSSLELLREVLSLSIALLSPESNCLNPGTTGASGPEPHRPFRHPRGGRVCVATWDSWDGPPFAPRPSKRKASGCRVSWVQEGPLRPWVGICEGFLERA